jgi:hypothetical protein
MAGSFAVACSLLFSVPVTAGAVTLSGESTTILRARETTDKKDLYPLYEYLRLSLLDVGKDGAISFQFGGWGRVDLADRTLDRYTDGDLQYAYMTYRPNKNNLIVSLGRQFVAEGVATERIDGVYLRSDFAKGFGVSVFAGSPVVTEPNFKIGGDVVYGVRAFFTLPKYYTIGASFLKDDGSDGRLREEEGIDLWLHPSSQFDVVGRSSYNSITSGWMEHAYTISYAPIKDLKINFDLSSINYADYFYNNSTTSALSLFNGTNGMIDPNESVLSLGGSVGYSPIKNLTIVADYKNYNYDILGGADYYGGRIAVTLPCSVYAGLSGHRMDGNNDKLRYNEFRVYASTRIDKLGLTADFFDVDYDRSINDIKNTLVVTASATYDITEQLRISANMDYAKDTEYDNAITGFLKLTYAFEKKFGSEGGAKP